MSDFDVFIVVDGIEVSVRESLNEARKRIECLDSLSYEERITLLTSINIAYARLTKLEEVFNDGIHIDMKKESAVFHSYCIDIRESVLRNSSLNFEKSKLFNESIKD